ncbi:glycosyl hydrolase family 3 N terminal domain-containing protein [Aspergillus pseudonomiae]|nr:glycosyl hydrolase family 3 N terminal domain-containing protein [Aspergillus pseudonomiae]
MIWTEGLGLAVTLLSVWKVSVVEHNNTSHSYFYELSEPRAKIGNETGDWAEAYAKARAFISQLTLEERNTLTYGISTTSNACSGVVAGIPRLGFPGLCFQDAGNGVRYTDFVNNYPSGIHIGASWNKSLAYDRAWYMGGEFRKKGPQVALGPAIGPLGRITTGGRNWEVPSNDSCLSGVMGGEDVKGMQAQGVIASVKIPWHFIAHEQELYSKVVDDAGKYTIEAVSSNIDGKTMQELYLQPFWDSIKAGAENIMCSYNRVNNSFGCQNSKTMNGLLKTELGFSGFTVSDWNAQHSGVAAS